MHNTYWGIHAANERGHHGFTCHVFAAAAEVIRRILVDDARRKASLKRGCDLDPIELPEIAQTSNEKQIDMLTLDEALTASSPD